MVSRIRNSVSDSFCKRAAKPMPAKKAKGISFPPFNRFGSQSFIDHGENLRGQRHRQVFRDHQLGRFPTRQKCHADLISFNRD